MLILAAVLAFLLTERGDGAAPAGPPVFASYELLALRIEAPLEKLFTQSRTDPEYVVDGVLANPASQGESHPVKISLRGHTSRRETECTFPKLKLSFQNEPAGGSIFACMKVLKVGTHCGEQANDTPTRRFGRLPNERSPLREAFVYRLLEVLGVPAPRARPARITYVYTDEGGSEGGQPRTVARNALLLEDDDDLVERLGGEREVDAKAFTTAAEMFAVEDSANIAFAQALLGNFDWCLMFTATDRYRCDARMKLWNVSAISIGGGKARPAISDFDVAGMVTGAHPWFDNVFSTAFVSSGSQREVEVIAQLQRTRSLFGRADLNAARARFLQRKDAAYAALDRAELDANGRQHIREYMDAFFREIASDAAFYRPVVTADGTQARTDPGNGSIVCGNKGSVPVGTPVSEPLQTRGESIQVHALDALWHYYDAPRCTTIHEGPVWIPAQSVSREFPR